MRDQEIDVVDPGRWFIATSIHIIKVIGPLVPGIQKKHIPIEIIESP